MEGGGGRYSYIVAAGSDSNFLYDQMASIQLFSAPHITKNVPNSMPSLTSQSCDDPLPAFCLFRQDGAIYRISRHSQTSDRLKKETSVKADC